VVGGEIEFDFDRNTVDWSGNHLQGTVTVKLPTDEQILITWSGNQGQMAR